MVFFQNLIDSLSENSITDYLISVAVFFSFTILAPMVSSLLIRLFHIKEKKILKIKRHAFYKPLRKFISILGIYIALKLLHLPENLTLFMDKSFRILTILLVSHGLANLFNSNSYEHIKKLINFTGNDALIAFISKVIKALIYLFAGFIIINELGYNLNGLVAGLGVFSAVIALAAQDLAKNIIAGCSIITDKPFEIGDYIEVDTLAGTVEDITFRSTRIRNTDNQIIVIPNSKVSDSILINCTQIEKRRFLLDLTLDLSTDLNKTMELIEKLKAMLCNHPDVLEEKLKVYFNTISSNGIDITLDFYTSVTDYMDFINFKHEMNYSILDLIQKEGIELAYDTQTLYVKH